MGLLNYQKCARREVTVLEARIRCTEAMKLSVLGGGGGRLIGAGELRMCAWRDGRACEGSGE